MKVKLLGTRGSHPTSNRENEHYGGSTSCIEVLAGDQKLILDAGTGILDANKGYKEDSNRIDILLTHLHVDHIQGLGFFKPLFDSQKEIHIWGPGQNNDDLRTRLNRFLSPPLFPVSLRDVECELTIHAIANSSFQIGDFHINSEFIIHPGPTVGFRIQHDSHTFTYIPDHEPMIGRSEFFECDEWISGFSLAADSDLMVHDAQYDQREYMTKIGWGHSSMHHAAELSLRAHVKRLVMFHHDPAHTDEVKTKMFEHFQQTHHYPFEMILAVQGSELEV